MAIPDFQTLMLPFLASTADGAEHTSKEITEKLSDQFGLSEEERQAMNPGGTARVMVNRAAWAKLYLKEAGLIQMMRRGVFRITESGMAVLRQSPARIDMKFLERYPSYIAFRDRSTPNEKVPEVQSVSNAESNTETPEEEIDKSYSEIVEALTVEILEQLRACSEKFFERMVVKLLVAMGYGGSIEDAGRAVGKSGDGGIDGVIKEDKLGLDVVVLQAKRWNSTTVGRPEIQSFAGSMEAHRASKGVFITTSTFSSQAREYITQIQRKIVLIDGASLAGLMIEHNIGVAPYRTFILKRLDSDFFDE